MVEMTRRQALQGIAAAGGLAFGLGAGGSASSADPPKKRKLALGFDNFSVRALEWKAPRLIEYAAELGVDAILFSDLYVFEKHDDASLREIRARADDLGIKIQSGTGGICPTSPRLNTDFGTPDEHLALCIRVAAALGSDVVRCFLGSARERQGEGGIRRHMKSTVEICKRHRSRALDAGVSIAIENHAGDMQAWELRELIEEAGKDYVGATVDAGNATWTLEDPVKNLEILGPYVVSSGVRDSMVWETDRGATVQWMAMGEGCVNLEAYMDTFERLCPKAPVQLEIISGFPRPFNYLEDEFWEPYRDARGPDFAAFVRLAKKGRPVEGFRPPEGVSRADAQKAFQKAELERSVRYCKEVLGLGLRGA